MGSSRRKDSASPPTRSRREDRDRDESDHRSKRRSPSPRDRRHHRSSRPSRSPRRRSQSPDRKRRRYPEARHRRSPDEDHSRRERGGDDRRDRSGSPSKRQRAEAENNKQDGEAPSNGAAAAVVNGDTAPAVTEAPVQRKAPILGRAGGVYIPPFKLARMMQEAQDKSSPQYQRMTWDALRKSINGLINKVNGANIKNILPELFQENLIRGRGLFCRSLMKSQMASPPFSPVYAGLVAVVNTKFPELGELLLHRVIGQFKRSYKRNDKPVCVAVTKFIAHLVNQGVVFEALALEVLILLLENPSEDGVEIACDFTKEAGAYLQDVSPTGLHSVFERFRAILHEGTIDKRVQFMIENLFAIRKAGFAASGFPAVKPELDLVEQEDQITHDIDLSTDLTENNALNVFNFDPEFEQHEKEYEAIKKELLGDESDGSEGEEEGSDDDSEEEEEEQDHVPMDIQDVTETNLVNLRRTIYLTLMSSMNFEEAGHKLMKMNIPAGHESVLVQMVMDCCSQERTYMRYYGNLAQRFCLLKREYQECFGECFGQQYAVIHRFETNKLRNVAKLFAHLLATDALSWGVLNCIRLTEEETTSSSRIFIKYLFQDLSENMGLVHLNKHLQDPDAQAQGWFDGIFPKDTQANVRFSINFFTSIGLGGITDQMRQYYKDMPKNLPPPPPLPASSSDDDSSDSDSDSDSSSSGSSGSDSDSSSDSDSDSESPPPRRKKR